MEVEGLMGERSTEEGEEEEVVDGELDASSVPELLASLGLHQLTRFTLAVFWKLILLLLACLNSMAGIGLTSWRGLTGV